MLSPLFLHSFATCTLQCKKNICRPLPPPQTCYFNSDFVCGGCWWYIAKPKWRPDALDRIWLIKKRLDEGVVRGEGFYIQANHLIAFISLWYVCLVIIITFRGYFIVFLTSLCPFSWNFFHLFQTFCPITNHHHSRESGWRKTDVKQECNVLLL